MNSHLSETQKEEIIQLLLEGKKIEAIKRIRMYYSMTLAESKKAAEEIEAQLIQSGRMQPRPQSAIGIGCLIILIILFIAGIAVYFLFKN